MSDATSVLAALSAAFPKGILVEETTFGDLSFGIAPQSLVAIAQSLRDEHGFNFLENLCGVDYLGRELRFEVVYHLLNLRTGLRLCLKVALPAENPSLPTVTHLWPTANYQERETYDLFGINFVDHPSLTRILMPDDWEGHPLRKDVPLGEEEVAFTFNQDQIYARKPFAKE